MTTVTIPAETDEALEELLRMAEGAPEPGTLSARQILHRGDDDLPAPMVASALSSAGYAFIYDTRTGERSLTNRNMLPSQLKKKRPDGTSVFTTRRPKVRPARGSHTCLLHPSRPERAHFDELGLPKCPKANLTSAHQVKRHMMNRHKVEWATIEEERVRREKAEEREFQRTLLSAGRMPSESREETGQGAGRKK